MIGTYGGGRGINPLRPPLFQRGKVAMESSNKCNTSKPGKAVLSKEENDLAHFEMTYFYRPSLLCEKGKDNSP
jgi:hypothetical protein